MDNAIVLVYLGGILCLGLWSGKGIRNLNDFSVVGRSYTSVVIFATLSASFIGGGFSMGNAEKVFRYGIVNIFALWGFSLKEVIVAQVIAPRMDRYRDAISVGDIMERTYGRLAKVVTGVFAVILCAGILGAQVGAIGYIFNVFLGTPQVWGILIGCGIVIAYSTVGGMKSVVLTDIVQFIVLGIGIPLTLILGIIHVGGIDAMRAAVPSGHLAFPGDSHTWLTFLSLFLTFLLGETLVPPYVQRLFLAKDSGHTARGTLWSGIFSFPFFAITGAIGLVALTLNGGLDANLSMPYVIKEVLPIGLRGIVIAGVISIVMSSADSFLNAASISAVNDVISPLRRARLPENRELVTVKIINLFVGVLAVIFAIKIESILDILIYSYNFWAPMILVPLASAILGLRVDGRHFVAGAVGGALGVLIWNYVLSNPAGVDGLIVGVLSNLIVFCIASVILGPAKPAGPKGTEVSLENR